MEENQSLQIRARPNIPNQLQWSDDNNIAITTHPSIHLLTPVHAGATAERRSSFLHVGIPSPSSSSQFKPSLEYDEPENIQTSYILPEGYRCSSWSPTGVSKLDACLLATVTTSHRVLIYGPKAHPANSEWIQVEDVTPQLEKLYASNGTNCSFASPTELNKFQTVSIAWSTKRSFMDSPLSDPNDISVIALGSKAGTVTLWGYHRSSGARYLASFTPHTSWVITLGWSRWHPIEGGCYAYVSTACGNGSVACTKVRIMLDTSGGTIVNADPHSNWFQQDRHATTVIKWFDEPILGAEDGSRHHLLCAVAKSAGVHIFSLSSLAGAGNSESTQCVSYRLPLGMGVSGLSWSTDGTRLRVFTIDGRHRTLLVPVAKTGKPLSPYDDESSTAFVIRQMVSKFKRQEAEENRRQAHEAEDDDEEDSDGEERGDGAKEPRIWGADASPNGLYVAFVYELTSSFDMEYKTEKFDISFLDLCLTHPRADENVEADIIARVRWKLADLDLLSHDNATSLLWDFIEYMEFDPNAGFAQFRLLNRFLSAMQEIHSSGLGTTVSPSENSASEVKTVASFHRKLYSHRGLNAARLMLHLDQNLIHIDLPPETRAQLRAAFDPLPHDICEHHTRAILTLAHSRTNAEFKNLDANSLTMLILLCDHALIAYAHRPQLLSFVKATYTRLAENCTGTAGAQGVQGRRRVAGTGEMPCMWGWGTAGFGVGGGVRERAFVAAVFDHAEGGADAESAGLR
ncbi:transcription factor IIIC subunit delta N-term-domain-containing protein [Jimgerdemannia flammicorona]|uniref:Transcription factor IIIC subunit delta N-term-domain-containing protein n=1 Tax=Jimgerdemannia flammicorona TaxID=994334 RepID=A0A433DFX2_9FUNG|nr:transcription factor IIIC subunit delta N-term-domain-containing protein [Jimgerdemannia flammicorona]